MIRPGDAGLRREVRRLFGGTSRGEASAVAPGAVGVELELLPLRPPDRPPTTEDDRTLDRLVSDAAGAGPAGRFTFEPGGQLEYSTPPMPSVRDLAADVDAVVGSLADEVAATGGALVARGLVPWFGPAAAGLRRATPRYREMDRYFAHRGPWGAWMMRLTASLQVNLDFGAPTVAADRWRLANALSPLLVASFANSPADLPDGTPLASGRAHVWSRVDPGRTGAAADPASSGPPWRGYLEFALGARVMFDAAMRPVGRTPPRFGDWWHGSEEPGAPPDFEDWRVHLTTLFPDVRPRGWMEIRSIDVPLRPWWAVPPALLSALLYDRRALRGATELLAALVPSGAEHRARAARLGLADPRLRDAAAELFRIGEEAMRRFPSGWFGGPARSATAGFRERFVEAGRTQSDEARERGEVARLPEDHAAGASPAPPAAAAATAASLPRRSS